jgi:hypothetical protein
VRSNEPVPSCGLPVVLSTSYGCPSLTDLRGLLFSISGDPVRELRHLWTTRNVRSRIPTNRLPLPRLREAHTGKLLMRSCPRPDKHLLRSEERWEAVRGAFAMRQGGRVDNLRILLLDDVMTTGATLDVCSRALCEAGAKPVAGLTVARAGSPLSSFAEHP